MLVNAKEFSRAVRQGAERAKKSPLPVLECVVIRIEAGKAKVYSTDLEKVARAEVVATEGELFICVPAKPLKGWLSALQPAKSDTIELSTWERPANDTLKRHDWQNKPKLIARCGGITASFWGIDPLEFPNVPE